MTDPAPTPARPEKPLKRSMDMNDGEFVLSAIGNLAMFRNDIQEEIEKGVRWLEKGDKPNALHSSHHIRMAMLIGDCLIDPGAALSEFAVELGAEEGGLRCPPLSNMARLAGIGLVLCMRVWEERKKAAAAAGGGS